MRLCVVKKIYCNLHDWYVHMMIIIHITFYLTPIAYKTTIISNGKRTTQQQSCGSSVWGTVKCVSRTFFLLHHRVFSLNTKSAAAGRIGMDREWCRSCKMIGWYAVQTDRQHCALSTRIKIFTSCRLTWSKSETYATRCDGFGWPDETKTVTTASWSSLSLQNCGGARDRSRSQWPA